MMVVVEVLVVLAKIVFVACLGQDLEIEKSDRLETSRRDWMLGKNLMNGILCECKRYRYKALHLGSDDQAVFRKTRKKIEDLPRNVK
jgi:hypothetical protein